ncbi:IucA/IucC family protein [Enterovibrio sp. 27052020O]|uniref:IucA/IucC family protein n=1 Tax=Enterovibrio sp. 27052020O TaxID=3241166 RepID=UPI00388E3481
MTNQQDNYGFEGHDVAVTCFLNAFLRECASVHVEHLEDGQCQLTIPMSHEKQIRYQVSRYSHLGLHEYLMPAFLVSKAGFIPLTFRDVVSHIVSEPALVGMLGKTQKHTFITRVIESHQNTQDAINHQGELARLFEGALRFETAEQGLLAGHSVHPAPKSREQFTAEDAKRYSPEFGGRFPLRWFAVADWLTLNGSSGNRSAYTRIDSLVDADLSLCALKHRCPKSYVLLPAHPWQANVLLAHEDIQNYLNKGLMIDLGEAGQDWYSTSSTRSLYSPSLPYMLKFSLSVRLTNSVRNLSLKEVIRGTRLNEVYQAHPFAKTDPLLAGFTVMQEPAFIGLLDRHGKVIDESLVALRENALQHSPAQEAVVLATLSQQHPDGKDNLLASRIKHYASAETISVEAAARKWFDAYCQHVVVPLFALQANYGIVFLAHQQNIVLRMHNGLPTGMYYRDCQGTGYTDLAYQLFPRVLVDDAQSVENYWDQDKVRRYFAYYLIINSSYNVVAAIASGCGLSEQSLLATLRENLCDLRTKGVKDSACLDYVLNSPTLCCKGNFYCYLQDFNENTIPDPKVIYFDLINPLSAQAANPNSHTLCNDEEANHV